MRTAKHGDKCEFSKYSQRTMKRERICEVRHLMGRPPGQLVQAKQEGGISLVCTFHARELNRELDGSAPIKNRTVKRQKPGPIDATQEDLVAAVAILVGKLGPKFSGSATMAQQTEAELPVREWTTIHLNDRGPGHGFYKFRGQGETLEVWKLGGGRITDQKFLKNFQIMAGFADELAAKSAKNRCEAPLCYDPAPMPEAD